MKIGDIVYFKSTYTAKYSKQGGSYYYQFKPGDRYRIDNVNDGWLTGDSVKTIGFDIRTGSITNLEDGTHHFAHSSHWEKIITLEEHRELQLNKLGI
jgi:hypothetical protein